MSSVIGKIITHTAPYAPVVDWALKKSLPTGTELYDSDQHLRQEWERECKDANKICEALGMTETEFRTEGGSLRVQRVIAEISRLKGKGSGS